jgi:hypothetical protein
MVSALVLCCCLIASAAGTAHARRAVLKTKKVDAASAAQSLSPQVPAMSDAMSSDPREARARDAYLRWQQAGTATPEEKELMDEFIFSRANRSDGNPLDNQGGPDGSGYRYVDSVTPDTAVFSWIELCGDANATDGPIGDDGSALAPLGFTFPFYGGSYTSVNIGTNGYLDFTAAASTFTNTCPFAAANPTDAIIAPYWDDLYAASAGGCANTGVAPWIRYRNFGTYFVVEWSQIPHYSASADRYTFEAILYSDGKVKTQYLTMSATVNPNSASIGIDAPGTSNGVEYGTCNSTTLPNGTANLAIWFYPGPPPAHDFATTAIISPAAVTYPGGASVTVTGTFRNGGSSTESSPIKYQFNGGAIVTENTGSVAPAATVNHSFATPITIPAAPGSYVLAVWSDLATDANRANDTLRVTVTTACGVTCQGGDVPEVTEVRTDPLYYLHDPDGGCNSLPPAYGAITCGQTVCGVGFTYVRTDTTPNQIYRDTDWYLFTTTQVETVRVTVTAEFPVQIGIVNGVSPCTAPAFIVSNTNAGVCLPTVATAACLAPGTYAMFVSPNVVGNGVPEPLRYRATLDCIPGNCPTPPVNDFCANAIHLSGTVSGLAWNNSAAQALAENSYCGMGHDIWYCWSTPCDVDVNVTTCGSSFDTKLAVFATDANCTCPGPTGLGLVCNDDTCGLQSAVSFHAAPGNYLIQVGGFSTNSGSGVLNINTSAPCFCDAPTQVTAIMDTSGHRIWVHFNAPSTTGRYKIYESTNKNNDGDPRSSDPAFTLRATIVAASAGTQTWTDTSAIGLYKNYVVIHDCASIGRCCYNAGSSCADNTSAECATLSGTWTSGASCTANPCAQLPANDDCGGAITISGPGTYTGDLTLATNSTVTDLCYGDVPNQDEWYRYTPATSGTVTVSLCAGTSFDSILDILTGSCPSPTSIACDDDFCGVASASEVTFAATAGTTYFVRVSAYAAGGGGPFSMTVTGP